MAKLKPTNGVIGFAWIQNKCKPIYGVRPIKRGKSKGKLEVIYLAKVNIYRKIIIDNNAIERMVIEETKPFKFSAQCGEK